MFEDVSLCRDIIRQVIDAIEKIQIRTGAIKSANDFLATATGMEKLDAVCMQFMAIGESLKKLDRMTQGELLAQYPTIDWVAIKGFRDIIAHHYFDIDVEQIFWIIEYELEPLYSTLKQMYTVL